MQRRQHPASRRRPPLSIAIALTAVVVAFIDSPASAQTRQAAAQRYVAIGCISMETASGVSAGREAAAPQFIITDRRGDPPLVYRLDGDVNTFKLHVGHTMEISGPVSPAPPAGPRDKATRGRSDRADRRGGAAVAGEQPANRAGLVMQVEKMVWIATSCRGVE